MTSQHFTSALVGAYGGMMGSGNPARAKLAPVPEGISLTKIEEALLLTVGERLGGLGPMSERAGETLRRTRVLLTVAATLVTDGNGLSAGQIGIIGLLRRTHELLRAGLEAATAGNAYAWSACLRGVVETIGAAAWVADAPERIVEIVRQDHIKPGKLIAAAERILPGLKDGYARLSDWIHPTSASLFLGLVEIDKENREIAFAVPSPWPNFAKFVTMAEPLISSVEVLHRIVGWLLQEHKREILLGKNVASVTRRGGRRLE